MRITVEQQMVSLLGLPKRFLRALLKGNIVEHDHPAFEGPFFISERAAGDTE
jgi:hypothetical protein